MSLAVARDNEVLLLTLDRPRAANALDPGLAHALASALRDAAADAGVRAVVLTGQGTRVFSAGADLKNPDALPLAVLAEKRAAALTAVLEAILDLPKPLVAAVNGTAAGAGAMIALLADRVVMATQARFVLPEIDVGLPTLLGLAILTDLAGSALAVDLVQSGRSMPAAEAHARGLATMVDEVELLAAAMNAARSLAAKDPAAFAANKAWVQRARRTGIEAAIRDSRAHRAARANTEAV